MRATLLFFILAIISIKQLAAQKAVQLGGHGHYEAQKGICLTDEQRISIEAELADSRKALIQQRQLKQSSKDGGNVLMNFPLQMSPDLDWRSGYAISNYVDQDASSSIQTHFCDNRTYDGHKGTDYYSWPFGGYLMESDGLQIIAAAPGTIIYKNDGQFDQQCEGNNTLVWNAVYVEHSDGTIAWYGHMKEGSLTNKGIGESVQVGEYLGVVGSSGFSTGPHLHFELHNADGSLIDPYFGDCNATDNTSTWANQAPYWEMELNTLLTHDAAPEFGCPAANEEPHIEEYFNTFETVYLAAYFKEQAIDAQVDYRIRTPDGTITDSWTQQMDANYQSSYWYWNMQIPLGAVAGAWTFEADYNQETFVREFFVNSEPSGLIDFEISQLDIYPNPAVDIVTVRLPDGLEAIDLFELQIVDLFGKQVDTKLTTELEGKLSLDISNLAESLYTILLVTEEASYYSPLIVKR